MDAMERAARELNLRRPARTIYNEDNKLAPMPWEFLTERERQGLIADAAAIIEVYRAGVR